MAAVEHVSVAVQDDFLARQTRAKPIPRLPSSSGMVSTATRARSTLSLPTMISPAACHEL